MTTSRAPAMHTLPSRQPVRTLIALALLGWASFAAHAQTLPALVDAQSLIGS
jgi:hypothetical protein